MITPRGGSGGAGQSPRQGHGEIIDLASYQRKRFESLHVHGCFNQEVVQTLLSILKNASLAGQTHARVQTIHLATDYAYSRRQPADPKALVVHDTLTLLPFKGTLTRINLAARPRELTEWLLEHKVHFMITTSCMSERVSDACEPTFANFMHIVAVFVPEEKEQSIWNSAFLKKSLDSSMVTGWNEKCLAAIRTGAAHFAICILYHRLDYLEAKGEEDDEFCCAEPRTHLSMTLIKDAHYRLDSKCKTLVNWARQIGYTWTLALAVDAHWAYFTVLLDPISKYASGV